ncbi:MAG: sensor histidine kinase [Planctomycetota bacterium]|jgi:signal transduction histidine kinase|nr:sensor histidine kinase [Planctomycetota bacterium]
MVALAVLPATGIGVFAISRMQAAMRANAIERDVFDTTTRARALEEFLRGLETDLLFLGRTQLLNDLAGARTAGDAERVDTLRRQSERELQLFSQGKRSFYQVRYIDTDGREVVRLNVEEGLPIAVPVSQLQDKRSRPYVEATLKLAEGDIYTSPMDLNAEHGRVEVPHRPVLRFGTPLFGPSGERTGILILNLNAAHLFRLLEPLQRGTEAFLVDQEGTYLSYIGPSDEKRARYSLAEKRELREDFTASEVGAILAPSDVGDHFESADELVSIASIATTSGQSPREWRLIVTQSRAEFGVPLRALTLDLSVIMAAVLAIVACVGVFVTGTLARPVTELRRAMRQIATDRGAGLRFSDPDPTDEIDGLSREFRLMAQRLEQAQSRLQGLQIGPAEAQRSSSFGQLISGMVQEFRDPLTALENKIRATGDSSQDTAAGALRENLLEEVEKLKAILESFSHVAKTSRSGAEVTSLAAVVESVVTLVGPELRQRGLLIGVDADPGVPAIEGDVNQLRQLLINLVLNAADARPKSDCIMLKISAVPSDEVEGAAPIGAAVRVIDDGRGIPTGDMVKIWDPFFTTKEDGVGLGLPICRQIVEEQRGRIEVSSQTDHGTTVTVSFPMAGASATPGTGGA